MARMTERVAAGESEPCLYFQLLKAGAGVTVGDFLCLLKTASETSSAATKGMAIVAESCRIQELQCVGHAMVRLRLGSLAEAYSLLMACMACADIMTRFLLQPCFSEETAAELSQQHQQSSSSSSSHQTQSAVEREMRRKGETHSRFADADDGDWVRVSWEGVASVGGAVVCGEGAWEDDGDAVMVGGGAQQLLSTTITAGEGGDGGGADSTMWKKEAPFSTHPSAARATSSRDDKFSKAFSHAVGKDKTSPPPPQSGVSTGSTIPATTGMSSSSSTSSVVLGEADNNGTNSSRTKMETAMRRKNEKNGSSATGRREDKKSAANAFSALLLDDDDDDGEDSDNC